MEKSLSNHRVSYKRHRYPPIVIQHAVWLCFRFTPGLREVEEMLAQRGVDVSYETIRAWTKKLGPKIAAPTAEDLNRALDALRQIDAACRKQAPAY